MSITRTLLTIPATIAALALSTAAHAHADLVSSTPAGGATVAAPAKLELRYNEKLAQKSWVELFRTGAQGKAATPAPIALSVALAADGRTLVAKLQKPLATGSYLIAWHAIAADGDRTNGTIRFIVR